MFRTSNDLPYFSLCLSFSLWIVWWQVHFILFFYPWLILLPTGSFVYNEKFCGSQDGNCPNIQNKEGGPMLPPKSWDFIKSVSKKPQDAHWASEGGSWGCPRPVGNLLKWMPVPFLWPWYNLKLCWSVLLDLITTVPRLWGVKPKRFSLFAISLKILRLLFQRKLDTTLGQLCGEKFLFWEKACCSDSSLSNVKCYSSPPWLL